MDLFSPGDCPTRPTLKRDGFELYENQFTVSGYARVEAKRLKQLFNPEIRKTGQVKARKDAKKLFKKEFFAAQLRHYDIKFKASGKVAEIRGLLETSLEQGKVREPGRIAHLPMPDTDRLPCAVRQASGIDGPLSAQNAKRLRTLAAGMGERCESVGG